MPERDNLFPEEPGFGDDVPIADAADQHRPAVDSPADEQSRLAHEPVPLEVSAADWQEQQETVVFDAELEEPDR
ncbi:hypothetical protein A5634_13465 [Mycobacterium asiaticum]|uniref:Uncharacterized protein n=1 Tax=Mycobacterium asiaticum TaxID=1790 RepID=A0A1A3PBR1_MYCAS|nr:hypothetical protein [Mycobacterium asiaticum]OBK31586.1 hypothetical protein A5634_13465 [Mycobacterium asiaticum]